MSSKVLLSCVVFVVAFSGCILDQIIVPDEPITEILYSTDFTEGDPYADGDGPWGQHGDGVYSYVVEGDQAYVTMQTGPNQGHTFRLKYEEPHRYNWNREIDVTYVFETDVKIIDLGTWRSFSFQLMGPHVDRYTVTFGDGAEGRNIRLERTGGDNPVAHDSELSEIFSNGSIVPAYQNQWIPIRVELRGGEIDLWVNDVHVLTYDDPDPILENFGIRFYTWGSEIAIDNVLLYTVQD